jgi:diaminopropionate ammonia-lyase
VAGVGDILLKDESDRFGLPAFKILGASWAVERTLRARPDVRTLVAASSGNHGRAVARVAAQRFLACEIYLPAASSGARAALISGEGAQVVRVDGGYEDAVRLAVRAAGQPGAALVADTALPGDPDEAFGESAGWVVEGYSTLFREVDEQAPGPVDVVLVPVGVGSLAAATVRWAAHRRPAAAVIAVEPTTAACLAASLALGEPATVPTPGTSMAGLDCATPSAAAWPTLRDGLAGAISVSDAEARQAIRDLAARGLTIGDCGAATVAALRALVDDPECAALRAASRLGPATTVLCIASEGASDPASYASALAGT